MIGIVNILQIAIMGLTGVSLDKYRKRRWKMTEIVKKKDVCIIAGILIFAFLIWIFMHFWNVGDGDMVQITVDGEEYGMWPLTEDKEISIDTQYGTNRICIKDGAASVKKADCPDGLCMQQGKTSSEDKVLVCLPHRLSVRIIGGETSDTDVDAVSQ